MGIANGRQASAPGLLGYVCGEEFYKGPRLAATLMNWSFGIQLVSHGPWWKQLEAARAAIETLCDQQMTAWPYPIGLVLDHVPIGGTQLIHLFKYTLPKLSAASPNVAFIVKYEDDLLVDVGLVMLFGGKRIVDVDGSMGLDDDDHVDSSGHKQVQSNLAAIAEDDEEVVPNEIWLEQAMLDAVDGDDAIDEPGSSSAAS